NLRAKSHYSPHNMANRVAFIPIPFRIMSRSALLNPTMKPAFSSFIMQQVSNIARSMKLRIRMDEMDNDCRWDEGCRAETVGKC
ncbi:hypothetical protein P9747_28285, partial [Paenibacillus macerans]|uniref:hypothetical protein n=1 Tax=Paenibacillus macerans TaxID=44252 RepID=UPI002E243309|nr:hypothetical protein [Paenibacillus macerans]